MQQVADDYGLEVSAGLPQAADRAISSKDEEKVVESIPLFQSTLAIQLVQAIVKNEQ